MPSINRTAFDATVHCLTGCAIGEVLGLVIATALGWHDLPSILLAIVLAFVFGYGLTIGPLVRGGLPLREALRLAREFRPDLIVLDVMLPGIDGFEVVRRLSSEGNRCPVLFLTARDGVADKITGLTVGGDDYVTKPFSLDEVIARIRAVLRRSSTGPAVPAARMSFGDIELDDDTHQVWKAGAEVALSPTEFNLLRYFMQNTGKVLSKAQILDHVWSYDFGGDANVVESYVSYLRRKIDTTEPRLLHTLRGVGYTLRLPRP